MRAVVGVDSGGSKTRALAVSFEGRVLGYAESGGGNPGHDDRHIENVRQSIVGAISGIDPGCVVRLVAGIAGFDGDDDADWASKATDAPGLTCARVEVNDADVALYGALEGQPGIVSIQGAGSMVMGRTEDGLRVRNRDFRHYASAAGPWIGYRTETRFLIDGPVTGDQELLAAYLEFRGAESLSQYRQIVFETRKDDYKAHFGNLAKMAPAVTAAAAKGSPTAIRVCRDGAANIVDGIRLVGQMFRDRQVSVILSGSCVRSPFMSTTVEAMLAEAPEKEYRVVQPAYPPVVGAVMMALDQEGVRLSAQALRAISADAQR